METSIAALSLTVIEIFRISKRQEQSVNKRFFLKNMYPPRARYFKQYHIGVGVTDNSVTATNLHIYFKILFI